MSGEENTAWGNFLGGENLLMFLEDSAPLVNKL